MNIPEHIWRRAESFMARRNRNRLIQNRTITPAYAMQLQLLVKNDDGSWSPEIRRYG